MKEDQRQSSARPLLGGFGILLLLWLLASWLLAGASLEERTRRLIRDESAALEVVVGSTAQAIDLGLDYLHGIPALVAGDDKVAAALSRFGAVSPSALPIEQRSLAWSRDKLLSRVNRYLDQVRRSLGADVVWVVNAAGDCIAASNSAQPESFVGTNYVDRDYFRSAREGKSGRQYAMGRKTNIPGLYFSSPINLGGRFAGAAVAKIDLPKLAHWVGQADAFVADEHGVIILARNHELEMRALPDAGIARLSDAERLGRYKRTAFPPLTISPWNEGRFPTLRQFDGNGLPLLVSSRTLTDEALEVRAFKSLPLVADFDRERLKLFLLVGASGILVLSAAAGAMLFTRIRRRSALRAAQSASLLGAAIEATADGILVVDNDRRVTVCNHRFADMWRIPQELVASGRDEELLHHVLDQVEDSQAFLTKIMDLYGHPESSSFDTLRFKDGTDIERYSFPQRLGDRIIGRVWSFRDVTERRRAEKALRDSRDELESRVEERTSDLQAANAALLAERSRQEDLIKQLAEAHSHLLQSEKMASIGQLAAGVAHEINNPVGFVNSNLTTLQEYVAGLQRLLAAYEKGEGEMAAATRATLAGLKREIDADYLREDVGHLIAESIDGLQRVKRIVQDLRDFSHVGESEKRWANIEQGLDSTLNVVWNELKYKAEVVKEYGGIPEIECIPEQINQVFMNLLLNAVQAIGDHGRITIRTGREGENVWVEVSDTGCGIAPENLKRIFDPFFTTKPVGTGTGLGLSLSYGIVAKHHGRFDVTSEVGAGSVFRLWLPLRQP